MTELKELIKQLQSVVSFSGFMVEALEAQQTYIMMELKSKVVLEKEIIILRYHRVLLGY